MCLKLDCQAVSHRNIENGRTTLFSLPLQLYFASLSNQKEKNVVTRALYPFKHNNPLNKFDKVNCLKKKVIRSNLTKIPFNP